MLTITLLGTAATMPLPDRALTAALAECGGHALLFDCGEGTQAAARRAGVNLMKLDAICLTHYHGDHIFGLPGLLQTLGLSGPDAPAGHLRPGGAGGGLAGPAHAGRAAAVSGKALVCSAGQPVALAALSSGWPAGAAAAGGTKHRVPSLGYRLDLPRAGSFDPAKARALGVPVPAWKLLQRGQSIPLENGAVVSPRMCWARHAGVCGSCSRAIPLPARRWNRPRRTPTFSSAMPPTLTTSRRRRQRSGGTAPLRRVRPLQKRLTCKPVLADALFAHDHRPEAALPNAQAVFPAAECGFDGKQIILQYDEETT